MDKVDKVDKKILKLLKRNARLTASAISDEIKLSVSAVIERIRKMESNGVISGYSVKIDNAKMGNNLVALMEVGLSHPDFFKDFTDFVNKHNNVDACYYKTGEYDFLLHIVTDSPDGLDNIYRDIMSCEGVSRTKTHLVLKTIKDELCVLPEEC